MFDATLIALSAMLAAFVALKMLLQARPAADVAPGNTCFLFAGNSMIDGTPDAYQMLDLAPDGSSDLARLQIALAPHFHDLNSAVSKRQSKRTVLRSRDGARELAIEHLENGMRLSLQASDATRGHVPQHHVDAMAAELDLLRTNTNIAPFLAWREDTDGKTTWVNRAYLDAVIEVFGQDRAGTWPLPSLFSETPALAQGPGSTPRRIKMLTALPDQTRWFDCTAETVGSETLFTAIDTTATVTAERRLRDFMQTLTETFAQLPIGLAIFDKKRRLVLFNPALTDLTSLKPDVLTSRPSLASFLDALREQRMMPEPRDYASWRASLSELELAAEQGTYEEIWSLSEGQTYRVTGRPHPDGAIALLFEDISSEIMLTRQFRTDLTLGQSVLDSLDQAIAVFSQTGVLTLSNAAYKSLWGHAADDTLIDQTITDITRRWASDCAPTPVWGDLRDFVQDRTQRSDWQATVQMSNGRALHCQFSPLHGGATLVSFQSDDALTIEQPLNRLSAV